MNWITFQFSGLGTYSYRPTPASPRTALSIYHHTVSSFRVPTYLKFESISMGWKRKGSGFNIRTLGILQVGIKKNVEREEVQYLSHLKMHGSS
jgi:hypothetical protein